jgi:hypothetical protein
MVCVAAPLRLFAEPQVPRSVLLELYMFTTADLSPVWASLIVKETGALDLNACPSGDVKEAVGLVVSGSKS